jgi:hypothetical protein
MSRLSDIWVQGFFDGFTPAGIFGQLERPGAPDELIDSRPAEESVQSSVQAAIKAFTEIESVFLLWATDTVNRLNARNPESARHLDFLLSITRDSLRVDHEWLRQVAWDEETQKEAKGELSKSVDEVQRKSETRPRN